MPREVGIVDYGVGNLFSVARGLHAAGCAASHIADPDSLQEFDAIVLPGVGAFGAGMKKLRERGMDEAILAFARSGKPMLGVCLGMQMLMNRSFEFGENQGLGLIPGNVVRIENRPGWPVPNIGWCEVEVRAPERPNPFSALDSGLDFYFVHSYHCVPDDPGDVAGVTDYGGQKLVALASRDNIHACQFHPEISAGGGVKIYSAFACMG